jgi:hypothetical protein
MLCAFSKGRSSDLISESSALESASFLEDPPTQKKLHRHVPLRSTFPLAMLNMEISIVACEKQYARRHSDLCSAGVHPRHKATGLSPSTACACLAARSSCESAILLEDWLAEPPAQSPPYGLDVRAHQGSSLLGGRSLSSDITMPLCLTTACACLAARWRAGSPAQLPPCGVAIRGSIPCRAGFQPRRKQMVLGPTTACAGSPAQSPPYGVDPKRELAPKLPNSNRPYCRLEINISPTKQRTEVLSNRSKSGVFWRQTSPPASTVEGLPAISSAEAMAEEQALAKVSRRSDLCGAGFQPRRTQMVLGPTTACAGSPAQFRTYAVDDRTCLPGSLVTRHLSLVTGFLIYGTGIRNRAKPLKTLDRDPF